MRFLNKLPHYQQLAAFSARLHLPTIGLLCLLALAGAQSLAVRGLSDDGFEEETSQSAARHSSVSLMIGYWKYAKGKAFLIVCARCVCGLSVCEWN